jgi:hypothetical protein
MLAKPYLENKRAYARMKGIIIQPKYNGVRCIATVEQGKTPTLRSSTGLPIFNFFEIENELSQLPNGVYDGELYHHGMPFQEISGIARTQHRTNDKAKLEYHIFDLVNPWPQVARLEELERRIRIGKIFSFLVWAENIYYLEKVSEETLLFQRDEWKKAGYEGLILRDPMGFYEKKKSNYLLKWKAKEQQWFEILNIHEELDIYKRGKDRLGAITMRCGRSLFKAGTGLTAEDRANYWTDRIIGWWALIEYPELTTKGVPHQPSIMMIKERKDNE